jgi:ABC-type cobalamin/Fe3+-siderophores transport systems, ATPase components
LTGLPLLEVALQRVLRGTRSVLGQIACRIEPGEVVGLLGPNGAGKSTLLRSLCGLLPFEGKVLVQGKTINSLRGRERAGLIAYVPQEHDVAWPISAADLVALGRDARRTSWAAKLSSEDQRAVVQAMERMDVARLASRPVDTLSGGERARVLIARALAQETPLLLTDEPAAGLDPLHQVNLMKTFRSLGDDGRTVVLSMHDLGLAARWCTRLILLNKGEVVADGSPEAVLRPDVIAQVYGVSAHIATVEGGLVVQVLEPTSTR